MRIAVCDDDRNYLNQIEKLIKELSPVSEIECYISVTDIINSGKSFDIAFLDIELDNKDDGFKAAQYVKRTNPDCVIAFFTNYDSYAREGYKYRAYRFILKDEGHTLIKHHFVETIKEYYRITGKISLIYGSGKRIVSVKDIMYIEMEDHYGAVYISDNSKCLWRKSLTNIEPHLSGFDFERCHNSYIINMDYVKEKIKNQFVLMNGKSIPIGRKYMKIINCKYKNL